MPLTPIVGREQVFDEADLQRSVSFLTWAAAFFSAAWGVLSLLIGQPYIGIVPGGLAVVLFVSLWAQSRGYERQARHVLFLACTLSLFMSSLYMPPQALLHWLQASVAVGAFPLFPKPQERMLAYGYAGLAIVAWAIPALITFPVYGGYLVSTEVAETVIAPFVGLTLLLTLVAMAGWFESLVNHQFRRLRDAQERSRQLAAVKTDFLAHMGHELRTPINGIVGLVELLQREVETDRQREMLTVVQDSARDLLATVDDLVDASQVGKGGMSIRTQPMDLHETLKVCRHSLSAQAEKIGVTLRATVAEDVPQWIVGDRDRVSQVVWNILHNAVKFSDHGDGRKPGDVTLDVQVNSSNALVIRVADHGIGMTPEMLERLFQPFSQEENVETRRFGGAGLGLSISKDIVQAMGGHISVTSQLGVGSVFTIEIPLIRADAPFGAASPLKEHRRSGAETEILPVLLVEDNAINRMVMQKQLESLGYTVEMAEDGYDGLRKFQEGSFALVLTDCHMPGMNGFDMAEQIRSKEKELGRQPTPIIAVTASPLQQDQTRSAQSGMNGFLTKPIRLEALEATLGRWVEAPEPAHVASVVALADRKGQTITRPDR